MEDLAFTRRMIEAGEAIGVKLQDHLVLGCTNQWVSLRDRGVWR
jgi:DNA repair protein RadC